MPADPPPQKLVAYYRVSTREQGESGLGLEAQRAAVEAYAASVGGRIVGSYTEVESGKRSDRRQLAAARDHASSARARLVIAKMDRLSRNVHFLSGLMESKVDFVACDVPFATPLTIHILAAVAEDEAKRISERTRAALAAYRAGKRVSKRTRDMFPGGVPPEVERARAGKLGAGLPECRGRMTPGQMAEGRRRGREAQAARAAALAGKVVERARQLRAAGATLGAVAAALNAAGHVTVSGMPYTAVAVWRVLNRAGRVPRV